MIHFQVLIVNEKQVKLAGIAIITPESQRIIDTGTYFNSASYYGRKERFIGGKTPHTVHVWWARRPFSAMKPLIFASLAKQLFTDATLHKLATNRLLTDDLSSQIQDQWEQEYGGRPAILDMFGGGGTIALSAIDLGVDISSIDINPLSVFLQKNFTKDFIKLPHTKSTIRDILQQSGELILTKLATATADLFPHRKEHTVAYLWTYSQKCSKCGYTFFLSKRPWLSKQRDPYLALQVSAGKKSQHFTMQRVPKCSAKNYATTYRQTSPLTTGQCPLCSVQLPSPSISNSTDVLTTEIKVIPQQKGKSYQFAQIQPSSDTLAAREEYLLNGLQVNPDEFPQIPKWSGITNPSLYGITSYYYFLNPRQRVVLLTLLQLLQQEYSNLKIKYDQQTATFIIGSLSSLIDQLIDWNSRLSMWISENQQPGRAFSGPGVSMYWDYCEIDPVAHGPANLWKKLDRIIKGIMALPKRPVTVSIRRANAQNLPFAAKSFDAIITDPPYYDNIFYSILADFFYSWKSILLRLLDPELITSFSSHDSQELVASYQRLQGSAHEFYVRGMASALNEAYRVLKADGVLSFIYTHASIAGWLAFIEFFALSDFIISSVQPLAIERKARPRGMNAKSIDTCFVFVARKYSIAQIDYHSLPEIKKKTREIAKDLQQQLPDYSPVELGLTIFANGVAMLSNLHTMDKTAESLQQIVNLIQDLIPSFKLSNRSTI